MSGNAVRAKSVGDTISYRLPEAIDYLTKPTGSLFGSNVFSLNVMKERLPQDVFRSLQRTIQEGKSLDVSTADAIASAMKAWATEKGATHYGHIFFPLTGLTAEKTILFSRPPPRAAPFRSFPARRSCSKSPTARAFPPGASGKPTKRAVTPPGT